MILLSRFHDPPRETVADAIDCGAPPAMLMVLSAPRAKKASERLSGDQKGSRAPSVPGNSCGEVESSERTQSCGKPFDNAVYAILRPSG